MAQQPPKVKRTAAYTETESSVVPSVNSSSKIARTRDVIGQNFGQAAEHAAPSGPMWKHQGHGVGRGLPHSEAVRVHELLECPVCTEAMLPPIYQCANGHTLCHNCKEQVNHRCPTCRVLLNFNIRCLALEKVAESLEMPCKFSKQGCHEVRTFYDKVKHEAECTFRPYSCPYAGSECPVSGDIPALVSHLLEDHKVDKHHGPIFNHRYVKEDPLQVENATWMLTVFTAFGQHFCLHFEAFQQGGTVPVYMAFLRFMGEEDEAQSFRYSLEVGSEGRKLIFQGVPRTIRDSHRKVRDANDGMIIPRNFALFMSGGDHKELKLRLSGRIWKEIPGKVQGYVFSDGKKPS